MRGHWAVALVMTACAKVAPGPLPAGKEATAQSQGCTLHATFTPDRTVLRLDEVLHGTFRLTSSCDLPVGRLAYGDRDSKYGRPESFRVEALGADGSSASQLSGGENFGGGSGRVPLGTKDPYVERLHLNQWVELTKPGRYEIVVDKHILVGDDQLTLHTSAFVDVFPTH